MYKNILFLVETVLGQRLLYTQFDTASCDTAPRAIHVFQDTLQYSRPWSTMLSDIQSRYFLGECGSATTSDCCYSSTNSDYTGGVGSAFLVGIEDGDYDSYLPQAANDNLYLKIQAINSTVLDNTSESNILCDGKCTDRSIQCFKNQTVRIYPDSNCRGNFDSLSLNTQHLHYNGELGSFDLNLILIQNATFKARFKTWVNYQYWTVGTSVIGDGVYIASAAASIIITCVFLALNVQHIWKKRTLYGVGNVVMYLLWLLYLLVSTVNMYSTIKTVIEITHFIGLIVFGFSTYISLLISAKMLMDYAIAPHLAKISRTLRWISFVVLTVIHVLTCWPLYLSYLAIYRLWDDQATSLFWDWQKYYTVWIFLIIVFNGIISTLWVIILQSARLGNRRSYSTVQMLKILHAKDGTFFKIFLAQLFLLSAYSVMSYAYIHIDSTMDFFGDEAVYVACYGIEMLILTCHYALMNAWIIRIKTVFKKHPRADVNLKPLQGSSGAQNVGCEDGNNTVELTGTGYCPRTTFEMRTVATEKIHDSLSK